MTVTALDRIQNAPVPASAMSQSTMVEATRAIAEVQAAVTVAQQCPRDIQRATGEMLDSCQRMGLAQRAFYTVPNRGHGPSVHLARELARIWGNVDYGVRELRRDDAAGESEVQAFAWDQQTNVRSTRTFIVPHARMKNGARVPLTDLGDIYLSNQNVGARAVRECIFTVLPMWLTEQAQDTCRTTLQNGEGTPLPERIANMVKKFAEIPVTVEQLETKTGKKRGQWDAGTVADLTIVYTSITRDGLSPDEVFAVAPVTAAEIMAAPTPPAPPAGGITRAQVGKIQAGCNDLGLTDRDLRLTWIAEQIGKPVASTNDLTKAEASIVIDVLTAALAGLPDPTDQGDDGPTEPTLDDPWDGQ